MHFSTFMSEVTFDRPNKIYNGEKIKNSEKLCKTKTDFSRAFFHINMFMGVFSLAVPTVILFQ